MSKFKKGDLVRRVRESSFLTVGKVYECVGYDDRGNMVVVRDDGLGGYFSERFFELAEKELTVRELCEWFGENMKSDTDAIMLFSDGEAYSVDFQDKETGTIYTKTIKQLTALVRGSKTFRSFEQQIEKDVDPERIRYADIVALEFEITEHNDKTFEDTNGFSLVSAELEIAEDAVLQYDNEFGFVELIEMDGVDIKRKVPVPNLSNLHRVCKTAFLDRRLSKLSRTSSTTDPSYLAI